MIDGSEMEGWRIRSLCLPVFSTHALCRRGDRSHWARGPNFSFLSLSFALSFAAGAESSHFCCHVGQSSSSEQPDRTRGEGVQAKATA